ncbi:putative pentatricopeptide repeat-containing protein At5g37570 [Magnolia sinica]|uniref:putative pentatricopeptide repeat-containing protein At5g37570 n=1 Tax=Magnolia sinica TaxID=86752 RepID=UPI0026586C33|nr:putative pentatricopeptide repeat-containing protein At5g37570 [Magnolia sinica]
MSLVCKSPIRFQPTDTTLSISTLFNACKTVRNLEQIHAHIILRGAEQDNFLITRFVCLCNSFSGTRYATAVFDRVARPNIYLWNSIIKGFCDNSILHNTILLFKRMKRSDTPPDRFTFPSLLKACSNELAVREGKAIHCAVVRCGVHADLYVRTGLVDFYGKCMEIGCARKVFDEMSERNVVSWTALIFGYVCSGDVGAARKLFDEMPNRNVASWNAMVDGYAKHGDLKTARRLFDEMPKRNVISYTSLIDGYAKAGDIASARYLFEQSIERDIVSWSALISGYAQNGQPDEALKLFIEMRNKNVKPDERIMVSLMSACSQVGSLELAKWVDSFITRGAIDLKQAHVTAALIDMNAKCGNMERALQLFETMPKRDMISYCSVIQGLSIHGCGAEAVRLFQRMLGEGLIPDNVAFTVILAACSHAGLVEEGCQYFKSMKEYGILPSPDHYACMVDLLGRAGRLREAYELIKSMPIEPHAGAWGALLRACGLHCEIELGEIVAGRLFEVEPHNAGNYVLLSNIYAAANRWSDVSEVRTRMRERGVKKIPGCSWI